MIFGLEVYKGSISTSYAKEMQLSVRWQKNYVQPWYPSTNSILLIFCSDKISGRFVNRWPNLLKED
jgi:hypothetical protein